MHRKSNSITSRSPKSGDTFATEVEGHGRITYTVSQVQTSPDGCVYAHFVGGGFARTDAMVPPSSGPKAFKPLATIKGIQ